MRRYTIKWKIFNYNITMIVILILFITIVFNIAVRIYLENNIKSQLHSVTSRAEDAALKTGGDFFMDKPPKPRGDLESKEPPSIDMDNLKPPVEETDLDNELYEYYFILDHSLKETLTILNADFILLDKSKNRITPFFSGNIPDDFLKQLKNQIDNSKTNSDEKYMRLNAAGTEYIAIVKSVGDKNSFGLGWIIIYSNVDKINQLQIEINVILGVILIFSALIVIIFSSRISKNICEPFYNLNEHVRAISERNFGTKIDMPVYGELSGFIDNFNTMSKKLEIYDKAQKTFLQNASHEFRTPLMSIQSYTEGIKYDVVDSDTATTVILAEIKRMTHLVEDLLYLSRLDAIEENYTYIPINLNQMILTCTQDMNWFAEKNSISLKNNFAVENIKIYGDEEKLSRAINNIINNCIRYAKKCITLELTVSDDNKVKLLICDDGPGFEEGELPNIFERFYKGRKGNFGLGLSISKNIIERLNGTISADNLKSGALFIIELPLYEPISEKLD